MVEIVAAAFINALIVALLLLLLLLLDDVALATALYSADLMPFACLDGGRRKISSCNVFPCALIKFSTSGSGIVTTFSLSMKTM